MDTYDLICIGCGPAGEKAATQAAYFHKKVAIIERQAQPGGAMVNTGTLPSKSLRETALVCSALKRCPIPGLSLDLDHSLSVPRFMARRHLIEQQEHDRIEQSIDRHGIDVLSGTGRMVDPHTVEITNRVGEVTQIKSEFILIATGSSPVRPDHIPFNDTTIVDADSVLTLNQLPKTMVVVGGGVIGCEYACIFAEIGVAITLINPNPSILPFVEEECRDHLVRAMKNQGVELCLNDSVSTVKENADNSVSVVLASGKTLQVDVLLWAAGRQSNTAGLGLEEVGVELANRGLVKVDTSGCTSVPSIYAAGDVIGFPALAATSMEQGRIASCHMFGLDFKKALTSTMPIGLYTIPAVSMVGITTIEKAVEEGFDPIIGKTSYHSNARGRMLGDDEGLVKCLFDLGSRKIIGATIIGEDATELIHLAELAIQKNAVIEDFIVTCFNYPSLSEMYKYAAYNALQNIAAKEGRTEELAGRSRAA